MNLTVVIPAWDEGESIGDVVERVPRRIAGVGKVDVIVVDDGSADGTADAARAHGAIVHSFKGHRGLPAAFRRGVELALEAGADVIVTIDADLQHDPSEIPKLVKPILDGEADYVIGCRDLGGARMSLVKRIGNRLASFATRMASGLDVPDAQSGFRAFTRDVAMGFNVVSKYTYVAETIIQASQKGHKVVCVPVTVRERDGRSRLYKGAVHYGINAGLTILRTYTRYRPLRAFTLLGLLASLAGLTLFARYAVIYLLRGTPGNIQSLLLAAVLLVVGFQFFIFAFLADLIDYNRRLEEEILYRLRKRNP